MRFFNVCIQHKWHRGFERSRGVRENQEPDQTRYHLIGENRGFDHTFGVYKPKGRGQTISNILSKGIVDIDGNPGTNYSLSQQYSVFATDLLLYRREEER